VFGIAAFRSWFRFYSIATVAILIVFAAVAFSWVLQVEAAQATPWLGVTERSSQYAHQSGRAVLAIVLLSSVPHERPNTRSGRRPLVRSSGAARERWPPLELVI
jgi:hypothetical protein